jgi:hypothetical protein
MVSASRLAVHPHLAPRTLEAFQPALHLHFMMPRMSLFIITLPVMLGGKDSTSLQLTPSRVNGQGARQMKLGSK